MVRILVTEHAIAVLNQDADSAAAQLDRLMGGHADGCGRLMRARLGEFRQLKVGDRYEHSI
ncbi:hypothetical protein [Streptomyces sp. MBT84]|uniref:hypothetical protein n=1 Tax=Streptomyces sp. MBT84 TaxID=1488414 RepID=UPI001C6F1071|nr:hypothetical protein [Streptomyces sp. MBT84]